MVGVDLQFTGLSDRVESPWNGATLLVIESGRNMAVRGERLVTMTRFAVGSHTPEA